MYTLPEKKEIIIISINSYSIKIVFKSQGSTPVGSFEKKNIFRSYFDKFLFNLNKFQVISDQQFIIIIISTNSYTILTNFRVQGSTPVWRLKNIYFFVAISTNSDSLYDINTIITYYKT